MNNNGLDVLQDCDVYRSDVGNTSQKHLNNNISVFRMWHEYVDIAFDLLSGIVSYEGRSVRLGKRELALLNYFIIHEGVVVNRHQILDHIWRGRLVGENNVLVTVSNLRRFIRYVDEDCCCLQTISGEGYIFHASKSGFLISREINEEEK